MTVSRKSKINELIKFDKQHAQKSMLIGTDEAGRGPVAGPVTAGAVYFNKFNKELKDVLKYLDDSKKFGSNHKLRKELAEEIKKYSIYSIQECSVEEIEKFNILQASLLAMKKACNDVMEQLIKTQSGTKHIKILVDGRFVMPHLNVEQTGVIKGDAKSASIAAASILAKVARDDLMISLAQEYPEYSWQKNKGYPTAAHLEAIREHGVTDWHRKSFLSKCLNKQQKLQFT